MDFQEAFRVETLSMDLNQAPALVIEMLVTSDYWSFLPLLPCFAAWIDTRNRSFI